MYGEAPGLSELVYLQGVSVGYTADTVLTQVSLSVRTGERVFVIGPSGSGKSTLLGLLCGILKPRTGIARLAGMDLGSLSSTERVTLRRKVGVVFQDFQLLTDRNLEENLWFVLEATGWKDRPIMARKIQEVLIQVGLLGKAHAMPHQLSAGEQQRLAIARAILNDPLLLLADEPTAHLDTATAEGIMELLMHISQRGTTVLMATHNMAVVQRYAQRVFSCQQGKIQEEAT